MQPASTGHNRTLRLSLVVTVLLVLLVLISIGSHNGAPGSGSQTRPTPGYVDWAMSVFLVIFVLMIPVAVWAYGFRMRELKSQRGQRSFQSRVIRSFVFIFLIAGVLGLAVLKRHGFQFAKFKGLPPLGAANGANGKKALHATPYNPTFRWPVLYLTLVLLAIGGAVWWRKRGRGTGVLTAPVDEFAEDVLASIDDALDDLEAEPDARRAVIAAYARMERALGRHGLRRMPSETAVEYLRRILLGLTSRADAVSRLTSLFEQAKFSRHEIDSSMKQDAIDALRTIRDDLQQGASA